MPHNIAGPLERQRRDLGAAHQWQPGNTSVNRPRNCFTYRVRLRRLSTAPVRQMWQVSTRRVHKQPRWKAGLLVYLQRRSRDDLTRWMSEISDRQRMDRNPKKAREKKTERERKREKTFFCLCSEHNLFRT